MRNMDSAAPKMVEDDDDDLSDVCNMLLLLKKPSTSDEDELPTPRRVQTEHDTREKPCVSEELSREQKRQKVHEVATASALQEPSGVAADDDLRHKYEESKARLEQVESCLRKLGEDLISLKESSCKDSELIQELNAQCKEKDLVIEELKKKVPEFSMEEDRAYKDSNFLDKLVTLKAEHIAILEKQLTVKDEQIAYMWKILGLDQTGWLHQKLAMDMSSLLD